MRRWSFHVLLFCFASSLAARLPAAEAEEPAEVAEPDANVDAALLEVNGAEPLAEVSVRAERSGQRLRESAQAVKVVDTAEAQRHSSDLGEVLARTEGVVVQRSGGLGSESRLSLHGLTGDQIRVFLDGVPLELSGFGFGLASVPVQWVERVEVYRGVVPVRLGADALGGAIDIISDQSARGTAAAASAAAGSFQTYQLALNARTLVSPSGLLLRASGFYDTSANDYRVNVRVPDELGRLQDARVPRFHDGYVAGGGRLQLGFVDRPWARRLLLEAFGTRFDKELQHNVNMSVPYGAANYGQVSFGGTLRYEQPGLGGTPLELNALVGYAYRRLDFEDTSRWVYDWYGQQVFERAEGSGETSTLASDSSQYEHRAIGRLSLGYPLGAGQRLGLVVTPDLTTRTGTERLRVNPDRIDPLTSDRAVLQLVAGLEHGYRDIDDTLENGVFAKYYLYRPTTDQVQVFDNSVRRIEDTTQRVGAGDTFRVWLSPWLLGKLSYEYATRLPRPDEVFGDGSLVVPNTELTPETGHNANAGLLLEAPIGALGSVSFEGTGFLRYTESMVVRLLAQDRIHSIHQNVGTASTLGVDGVFAWTSRARLAEVQLNATWQDQRNRSTSGVFAPFEGQRIPNRPWLFANASATLRFAGLVVANDELSLSWVSRYVYEFLPGWEQAGPADTTNSIPTQLTHSLGAVYSHYGPWSSDLALDVTNLTDERVYDVLGVQRPGRAAFLRLTVAWSLPLASPSELGSAEPTL